MSYNARGLAAQQTRTARLTSLMTSSFAFLRENGLNTQECKKWLEQQTPEDRALLENFFDRTQGIQNVLRNAPLPNATTKTE